MLFLSIEKLLPGEKLAKPIYTDDYRVLVAANIELSAGMIQRLKELGVSHVYVQDERTDDLAFEEILSDEIRMKAVLTVKKSFQILRGASHANWHQTASTLRDFRTVFEEILSEVEGKKDSLLHLGSIYSKDSYLYSHSINVGIYSAVVGLSLGLNHSQMIDLGVGAILHDIGKTQIPLEILTKPGALTKEEYEIMKTHTTIGYQILRTSDDISLLSAHCALQHHERMDGSGYPRNLQGDEVHLYGRIVGICDMYDALVSNRVYRKAMMPHTALEMMFGCASSGQFDLSLVENFQRHVAVYPIGLPVLLSTGERGVVSSVDPTCPQRPKVRVLIGSGGESVTPFERDLASELTIMIEDCGNVLDPVLAVSR